jgi:hypothetical protein
VAAELVDAQPGVSPASMQVSGSMWRCGRARHIEDPHPNFYTRGKVVTARWPDPATSKVDLGFRQTR